MEGYKFFMLCCFIPIMIFWNSVGIIYICKTIQKIEKKISEKGK